MGPRLENLTMEPFFSDGQVTLYHGHALAVLRELPSDSVQCVVTSPPYWGLRNYGTDAQIWGGDPDHAHVWKLDNNWKAQTGGQGEASEKQVTNEGSQEAQRVAARGVCECGAWRGELGHEPTPQMFVAHLVDIFREVRRVLKSDGVCFVNLGDSYAGSGKGPSSQNGITKQHSNMGSLGVLGGATPEGTRAKSLILIPERFAIAMQDDGWLVRSRIAWCKRAPMPESVKDRPTSAWEHVYMLTNSPAYFWNAAAVRVPSAEPERIRSDRFGGLNGHSVRHGPQSVSNGHTTRNMWNYWPIPDDELPDSIAWELAPGPERLAHFATFPREIPRRCIAAASREGDTVLDIFVGSGTTTRVARSMLRRSIGIDLSETYLSEIALQKDNQMALIPALEETV